MWRTALRFSAVGLEMGIAVAVGYGVGWWLDRKLGTDPYLMIVMVLCGIGAAFKAVIDAARRASQDDMQGDDRPGERKQGPGERERGPGGREQK